MSAAGEHLLQQPGQQLGVEGVRQAQQLAAPPGAQQAAKDVLRHAVARIQVLARACMAVRSAYNSICQHARHKLQFEVC